MCGLPCVGDQPPTETELLGSQSVLYCFHTSQGCNFFKSSCNHRSSGGNRCEKENLKYQHVYNTCVFKSILYVLSQIVCLIKINAVLVLLICLSEDLLSVWTCDLGFVLGSVDLEGLPTNCMPVAVALDPTWKPQTREL